MSTAIPTRALGGDATHIKIGQVGLGLMGLTWTEPHNITPDAQAFDMMRAAVDSGVTLFDAGAFYGPPSNPYANLHLLRRFFSAEPTYAARVTLCVKGGMTIAGYKERGLEGFKPDGSLEHLREDLSGIREALGSDEGGHEVDVYQCARKQPDMEIETLMSNLLVLKAEGHFGHIGLSELSSLSIERACRVAPVALVEVEYSTLELSIETNGVLALCTSLQIPILAYSPLGKGWLSGSIRGLHSVPAGDVRVHLDSFRTENAAQNALLADKYADVAAKRTHPITSAQLALAWLIHQSPTRLIVPIPGTSRAERVRENAGAAKVEMDEEELRTLRGFVESNRIKGERCNAKMREFGNLWG